MIDLSREREMLRRRVLGWSFASEAIEPGQDIGRDLRLVGGPRGRDFARVDGLDALAQSLAIALTTLLGSDVFNTDFGFDGLNALVEGADPVIARERVRVAVIQVLRKEPRVRRIVDVKLLDGRLDPTSLPTSGDTDDDPAARQARSRELHVRVAFETVSGDQATVDLGRLVPNG